MSLSEQIMSDMKEAMKSRDKIKLNTVRMIKSALMNEKIKVGHDLTPDEELTVLNREKKQREESIEDFTKAKREDLAEDTKKELEDLVTESIKEAGATSKSEFGKVMKVLMPKIKGKADGKVASDAVRNHLN